MDFADFDPAVFLRDYWQKKPLLIRNPWRDWHNPLAPDELAGLACEDGLEARLITTKPKGWKVEHGPFAEARFAKRSKHPWTLLVQAVDQHCPAVAALIAPFRFVPNWRIDDVMVSYASDQGGVGPHFDQYDVFLIQGLGQRRWQIGGLCDEATVLLPNDDLRLLTAFEPVAEYVLDPGDMLYLPPRIAHNGVAIGDDCMTYSIGFRAPARAELIAHYCDHLLETLDEDDRYADPDLVAPANPGEIGAEALARLHAMVSDSLGDRAAFARWFGGYTSTPKYAETDWAPETPVDEAELRARLAAGDALCRNPASRFVFVRESKALVLLFVDGESFDCAGDTAALAEALCAHEALPVDPAIAASPAAIALLLTLLNQGSLAFEAED